MKLKKIPQVFAVVFMFLLANFTLSLAGQRGDHESYTRYSNKTFNYSILIPQCWKKTEADLSYKHILIFQRGASAEIKISAENVDEVLVRKWADWEEWYSRGIGGKPYEIIETGEVSIDAETKGKLLLIEYPYKNQKMIRRVLIARHGNLMLTIECGGTTKQFYAYNNVFNTVMGSLVFPGTKEKGDTGMTRKEDEKKTDEEATPENEPAKEKEEETK